MAQGNFDPCFRFTIGEEGQYSGTSKDPGNWSGGQVGVGRLIGTCWGISAPTLLAWLGTEAAKTTTAFTMKNLPITTARSIYLKNYWNHVRGEELPLGLDLTVWDFGVNAGVSRSIKELQTCVGVDDDGALGPVTMSAVAGFDVATLIDFLIEAHEEFYRTVPGYGEFGVGWIRRQENLKATALAML